jgi:hypothetical protein
VRLFVRLGFVVWCALSLYGFALRCCRKAALIFLGVFVVFFLLVDGTRSLVVPVLMNADTLSFAGFLVAYDDIVRKVKANKLTIADFQGANVSITNPGTIGTVQSVPRLMPGQGVIVGVLPARSWFDFE